MNDQSTPPVVLITGSNSGIGKAAAIELARRGWQVFAAARSVERGQAAVSQIQKDSGSIAVELLEMDLTSFASVRRGVDELLERTDRLDVLVNNAGLTLNDRRLTVDGHETMMQTNHLSPVLLTSLLLPKLLESDDARVVNVSSRVYERIDAMPLDDLNFEHYWGGIRPYCATKLANILFTNELHRRTHDAGLATFSVHPGVVATNFAQNFPPAFRVGLKLLRPLLRSPEQGAAPVVELVTESARRADAGEYFDRHTLTQQQPHASDREAAERLWDLSNEITGAEWPAS
ncbi:MAG: SDR family NAD(P)-dependent oxidoreductase [Chloroflexi bacterium]|nr:SDR family NAD(P)-dependent oxidoreductase [Chloroflexota bacterium]MYD16196.1 SDR family NAD(P)-dependent oxidoreductase [Chloroflexota bacterium]MYJ01483.1 SDR family NAD(P)-dependent oxidoreductase [Chloroflexota bacterium]